MKSARALVGLRFRLTQCLLGAIEFVLEVLIRTARRLAGIEEVSESATTTFSTRTLTTHQAGADGQEQEREEGNMTAATK